MNYSMRVKDVKINIDDAQVRTFFENRTKKKLPYMVNYINYQDNHPELALERDEYESKRIMPLLEFKRHSKVLDIGCGVGRWAKHIFTNRELQCEYSGVDYSHNLLKLAKCYFANNSKCCFYEGNFQEILSVLPKHDIKNRYDMVFINGVMMYINDEDIKLCLENTKKLVKRNGRIYFKESVGIKNRLTLDKIYSDELTSQYSAIYRSINEYDALIKEYFLNDGYKLVHKDAMWSSDLENRKETTAYFWILEKE